MIWHTHRNHLLFELARNFKEKIEIAQDGNEKVAMSKIITGILSAGSKRITATFSPPWKELYGNGDDG